MGHGANGLHFTVHLAAQRCLLLAVVQLIILSNKTLDFIFQSNKLFL